MQLTLADFTRLPAAPHRLLHSSCDHAVLVSLAASSLSLLRRVTVALAVSAGAVDSYQAPPATVFLQALHVQMPTACLFTVS